jgi:hypothetical protein
MKVLLGYPNNNFSGNVYWGVLEMLYTDKSMLDQTVFPASNKQISYRKRCLVACLEGRNCRKDQKEKFQVQKVHFYFLLFLKKFFTETFAEYLSLVLHPHVVNPIKPMAVDA